MNVHTIEVQKDDAMQKLSAYRGLNARQKTLEDQRLEQMYKAVSKGARVLNIYEAFKATGLNEQGQPKLAIARADWKECHLNTWHHLNTCEFNHERYSNRRPIKLPDHTFAEGQVSYSSAHCPVPHIPPDIRPTIALSNFHILFEVQKWDEYPVDPFLLRHIAGGLYVVIAEWELTELEASLLGSMRAGN